MAINTNNSPNRYRLTKSLTDEAKFFLEINNPKQRQYEALRAFFVENLNVKTISEQFGYSPCHGYQK